MLSIIFTREIKAPKQTVWDVIADTAAYAQWNPFVPSCKSSFVVGSPIVMKVRLLPSLTITQKETIQQNRPGEFLAYGVNIPLSILSSTRQHVLTAIDENTTRYESVFILKGALSSVVSALLKKNLTQGFSDMTDGLVARAEQLAKQ
jgi:hypothetical protein